MDLENYLIEKRLKKDPDLLNFFNSFATQVFTQGFSNKIHKAIPNLKIKETVSSNKNLAAYTNSYETIFVNRPVFYRLNRTQQISILMHEFIHVLQFKKNREIRRLSLEVWNFFNRNKLPNATVSEAVLGKKFIKSKFINKNEILPYLMNERVRWEYMSEGSKEGLRDLLSSSKVFQTDSRFWKERLE